MPGTSLSIGVILAGCGVNDGAEIHEAVLTLLAISRHNAQAKIYAPNIPQHHVINHLTGAEMPETRNVLIESARIARGQIADLATFKADEIDALVIPGGFGAAKNLCDFALKGADCTVNPQVADAVKAMVAALKPVGALCIAPVVLARIMGDVHVTIGQDSVTAAAIQQMGGQHHPTHQAQIYIDHRHKVVTSPCYMLESTIAEIAEGTDAVIKALIALTTRH